MSALRVRPGRLVELLLLTVLLQGTALAQTAHPPVEVYVGYSRLPADGNDFPRQTSQGVQMAVAVDVTTWFGLVGELAAQFNTAQNPGLNSSGEKAKSRVLEYLFGPRFAARFGRVGLFGHGLFGVADGHVDGDFGGFSSRELAFGGGAGFDVHVHRRAAIRMQFDALASFADIVEQNSRFGVGLVMRFGGP